MRFLLIFTILYSFAFANDEQNGTISYSDLMQSLNNSSSLIHNGILTQDKKMVKDGASSIAHHKTPTQSPWLIMEPFQQSAFKKVVTESDLDMHQIADAIIKITDKEDWTKIQKAFHQLTLTCISCHIKWKNEADYAKAIEKSIAKPNSHTHTHLQSSTKQPIRLIRDLPRRDIP